MPDPAPREGIAPTVKGLALVSLLNDFASEMVYPLLPAFVVGTLGGSATMLGALDGAADLAASGTKWLAGSLADRPGRRKPLILGGYWLAALIRPVIAMAGAAWQVVGLRVVDRVGKGFRSPPRDALIAEVTPPALRGRAFGYHRMADHLGSVPGALLAWWLLSLGWETRQVLMVSVLPGIAAAVVLVLVLRRAPAHAVSDAPARLTEPAVPGVVAHPPGFWPPVLALALLVLLRLPETLLLLRLQDAGLAAALVPLVWAGLHVVRTGVSYPGGWLADHLGPRGAVAAGGVAFALGAAGLAAVGTPVLAVAVFLALGVVAGLMEPAERLLVARLAPKRTGRGYGAYHSVTGLAALPAGVAFGALYTGAGGSAALLASAGGMLLATGVWLAATRRLENGEG
ncbi:MAG: MFS transporter [Gemmatimonadetes bacterium]|nr:MFS transporter [Gemmatimonadota bacterium]